MFKVVDQFGFAKIAIYAISSHSVVPETPFEEQQIRGHPEKCHVSCPYVSGTYIVHLYREIESSLIQN